MNPFFQLFLECIFVGLYSIFLFYILTIFTSITLFLIFLLGFFKHFFGYYLGIHTYYCNHSHTCKKNQNHNNKYIATNRNLFYESILEGLAFVILYSLYIWTFPYLQKLRLLSIFFIGFSLHLFSEFIGLHNYFCKNHCKKLFLFRKIKY